MTTREIKNLNKLTRDLYFEMIQEYDYKKNGTKKSIGFLAYMIDQIYETMKAGENGHGVI